MTVQDSAPAPDSAATAAAAATNRDAAPKVDASDTQAIKITYDEQLYPARPRALGPRARRRPVIPPDSAPPFAADGRNRAYVEWLEDMSMLSDANTMGRQLSGQAGMWQNPYAYPNPRAAVEKASVWFTAYPLSLITAPGESFLAALGDEDLWAAFEQIGVEAIHTGPVKRAGGLDGWDPTPSVDGHFDRISMAIDPLFGTEEEFRTMCEVAAAHGGDDHRRHRPRAHRQGRRLPARRDEPPGLPGHLPHDRHPGGRLAPAAGRPGRSGLGQHRRRRPRRPCRTPVTSSASCSG